MLLKLDNISFFKEKSGIPVLDTVNFSIEAGGFLGIIGHIGSGKSVLLEIMAEIIFPHSGKLISKPGIKKCILFQNSEDIFSQETVYDELALGLRYMGEEAIREKVLNVLKHVCIDTAFLERSPFSLSDGEKRRLALALFLLIEPDILFLDEPLQGLDPRNKKTVLELLKNLKKNTGITIVMVSSSLKDILFYADTLLFLDAGKVLFYGHTEKCFEVPGFLDYFKNDIPVSIALYNRLLERGILKKNVFVLDEEKLISLITSTLKRKK